MMGLADVIYICYFFVIVFCIYSIYLSVIQPYKPISLLPLSDSEASLMVQAFDDRSQGLLIDHMYRKLESLYNNSKTSILVHFHIVKTGGSALSLALTTECSCNQTKKKAQDLCIGCKRVTTQYGSHSYSASRFNGWEFGMHVPLFLLYQRATRLLQEQGMFPVFIISLRDPFYRFLSESISLTRGKYFSGDWSAVVHKRVQRKPGTTTFFGVKAKNRTKKHDTAANSIEPFLEDYVNLPSSFILHNRQVKMIGGIGSDFDLHFVTRESIGSIWKANDTTESISKVKTRAKTIVLTNMNNLLSLHERLEESLCVIEVLYGELYRFRWNLQDHAHNAHNSHFVSSGRGAYNYAEEQKKYAKYLNTTLHETWLVKNKAEVELYAEIKVIFDAQFEAALTFLQARNFSQTQLQKDTPHCLNYI